jgi:hypothetical protein
MMGVFIIYADGPLAWNVLKRFVERSDYTAEGRILTGQNPSTRARFLTNLQCSLYLVNDYFIQTPESLFL